MSNTDKPPRVYRKDRCCRCELSSGLLDNVLVAGALLYLLCQMTDKEMRLLRDLLNDYQPRDIRKVAKKMAEERH